jgi:hypothetical protein
MSTGASDNLFRNVMPNYLIQWEMIRWAAENRCAVYDFSGRLRNLSEENKNRCTGCTALSAALAERLTNCAVNLIFSTARAGQFFDMALGVHDNCGAFEKKSASTPDERAAFNHALCAYL